MKILMLLSKLFMIDLRVYNEAIALTKKGHKVTIIVWDRLKQYPKEDIVDGIKIIRIHNDFLMKVLPNDIFRNPPWWYRAYKTGLNLHKNGFNFDVVHCHDLDTLPAGILIKNKTGCKLVYDAHEIFGYMIEGNVPKIVVKTAFALEKKLVKKVDHIITVNEPLDNYFKNISKKPITIVMNCKNLKTKTFQKTKNKIFTIVFIGTIDKGRLFPEIIDTIGSIDNIKFIIAGKNENVNLYNKVKNTSSKYKNVEFLGQIPFNKVMNLTSKADLIINPVDSSTRNSKITTPNKLLEAMATGKPIICNKNTHAGELTEKNKCGLVVESNLDSIKKAIIKLRDDPVLCEELGKNGLEKAIKEYNWAKQKEKLIQTYNKI